MKRAKLNTRGPDEPEKKRNGEGTPEALSRETAFKIAGKQKEEEGR